MRKTDKSGSQTASCRIRKSTQARLVRSSQMPKDFFSDSHSPELTLKPNISNDLIDEK
jgi:hypothetical protein